MSLDTTDLFVIQKVDILSTTKLQLRILLYIEASPAVTFKGKVNLTLPPSGQGVLPANNGDLYVNDTQGVSDAGWTGITAGTAVEVGDRVFWDDDPGEWVLIQDGGDPGGQVDEIIGQTPINVDTTVVGTPVKLLSSLLTNYYYGDPGAVERLASKLMLLMEPLVLLLYRMTTENY